MSEKTQRNLLSRDEFRVLVVDDEELYAQAIGRELRKKKIDCDLAYSAREALDAAAKRPYPVILLDHRLPDEDGISIIPVLLATQISTSIIMMTAYETIQNAIQAIRQGAEDYIVKETSTKPIVARVAEIRKREEVRRRNEGWQEHRREGLLGKSAGILRVIEQLEKVAASPDTTVLITGETGAGKEVAARHLHRISTADPAPFISVDCVALPGELVESLLFGHERGAFTGADRAREGAFYEAGEGTLLLDEIGDMDLFLQGKLLRVLESRTYQRVGSVKEYPVRCRVVASTNRDLAELCEKGAFRFDLYQRLAVFPIHVPPLRERGRDILLLSGHFMDFFGSKIGVNLDPLAEDIQKRLLDYDYPGNVRELRNMIERAVILAEEGRIDLQHLPERILRQDRPPATGESIPFDFVPGVDSLESLEMRMIHQALKQAKGVKAEAARMLGISRFQLLRRMEKHGLTEGKKK